MDPFKTPMVVEYVKILHSEDGPPINVGAHDSSQIKAGDLKEIRPIGVRFCCVDMANRFRLGHIGFGSRSDEVFRNKTAEVYVRIDAEPGPDQNKTKNDLAIPYCPFCREPVLTEEIATL